MVPQAWLSQGLDLDIESSVSIQCDTEMVVANSSTLLPSGCGDSGSSPCLDCA